MLQDEGVNSSPQPTSSIARTVHGWSRARSLTFVAVLYVVACAVSLIVADTWGSDHPLTALVVGFAVTVVILYVASQIVVNGSTFDAWWSVVPPVYAVWLAVLFDDAGTFSSADQRRWIVAALALMWGIRLTANWALGWPGLHHEDWRYRQLYATVPLPRWAVSLLSVHVFPWLVVTLGSMPFVAVATHANNDLGIFDALGSLVVLIGVGLEHFADVDLRRFNRTKKPGDVLSRGLWSRSRHPNYLGEMLWWWGLWLFVLAAHPESWWMGIGALAMTTMFLTASIPMAEKRSAERRPDWAAYKTRTPILLPRLGKG